MWRGPLRTFPRLSILSSRFSHLYFLCLTKDAPDRKVMPTCFLVLLRHFLYVDRVVARSQETRFFHVFGSKHVIRSVVFKEAVGKRDERGHPCSGEFMWSLKLTLRAVMILL